MKRGLIVLVCLTALVGPARAQDTPSAEALAAAQDLSALMSGESMANLRAAVTSQVWGAMEHDIGSRASPAAVAEIKAEFERAVAELSDAIMQDAPAIYARHFTAQELKDMVAFYRSPAGTKAMKEMPLVLTEIGQQTAPRLMHLQQGLGARVDAILRKYGSH
jgi:hypothetical protein